MNVEGNFVSAVLLSTSDQWDAVSSVCVSRLPRRGSIPLTAIHSAAFTPNADAREAGKPGH